MASRWCGALCVGVNLTSKRNYATLIVLTCENEAKQPVKLHLKGLSLSCTRLCFTSEEACMKP